MQGIPGGSRASKGTSLSKDDINEALITKLNQLNEVAAERNQSLAQMSLAWVLREEKVTSALIGASSVDQIKENVKALKLMTFSKEELKTIDKIVKE